MTAQLRWVSALNVCKSSIDVIALVSSKTSTDACGGLITSMKNHTPSCVMCFILVGLGR